MEKVSENLFKNRIRQSNTPLMIVTGIFVTLYLTSNIMAVKVVDIFDLMYFDAGTLTFPFAYMLGDVMTEIWGYKTSRKIIFLTLLCNVIMVVFTSIGTCLPSPGYLSQTADAYNHIFHYVPRIVLASWVGFLFGELSNAWFMVKIKEWTRGRWLWVRTIGSSVIGYILDSLPFVLIAFGGTVSGHDLVMMILFQYVSKLLIEAFFGTPMAYLTIHGIELFYKKREKK